MDSYRRYAVYRRIGVPLQLAFEAAWHLAWMVKCAVWGPRKLKSPPPMNALERELLEEAARNASRWRD